jgi:ribosomal protein S27E
MSVDGSSGNPGPTVSPDEPLALRGSASYMGCRHCEEGSLVYDSEAGASRCRACGKLD